MSLIILLKFIHLVGVIAGFGGALAADVTLLRGAVMQPLSLKTMETVRRLAYLTTAGLAVLWVSGVALVWVRYSADPAVISNGKLWAKIAIVAVLTLNGALLHRFILPHLETHIGERLFSLDRLGTMAVLGGIGAVSLVSWFTPAVLGLAPEMNHVVPAADILWTYAWLVLAVWLGLLVISVLTIKDGDAEAVPEEDGAVVQLTSAVLNRRAAALAARNIPTREAA